LVGILGNQSFFRLWLGSLLATAGMHVSRCALLLYVFDTTGSVLNLVLLVIFESLPGVAVAPFAGAAIDGWSKRGVLVASALARLIATAVVLLRPSLGAVYLMAALHSFITAFFQPAKSAAIPFAVRAEDLARANGVDQCAGNLALVLGPVTGAELLTHFGLTAALAVEAAMLVLCTLLIAGVRLRRGEGAAKGCPTVAITNIRDGWTYLVSHRLALHLSLLFFTALTCTGVWTPLAPFFIRDRLGGSENVFGWQIGILGLGAGLGSLCAPIVVEWIGKGLALLLGLLGEGVAFIAYALISDPAVSTAMMFIWGFAVSMNVVPFYTILQAVVEESFLGRVMTVVKQLENFALVLAVLAALLMHGFVSSTTIFLTAGLLYFAVTASSSFSRSGRMLLSLR
jgi:MFS family permease